jgi:hypothetical protein
MKKISAILIILTAAFLFTAQSCIGSSFYSFLFEGEFFMDIITFILAGLLIFYLIKIIEMIFQLLTELLIFHNNDMPKTKLHKRN